MSLGSCHCNVWMWFLSTWAAYCSSCVLKLQIATPFLKHSVKWCSRCGLECSMKDQTTSGCKKLKSLWCSCKSVMHDTHARKLAWRHTVCVIVQKGDGWARAELRMGRDALKSSWGIAMAVLCAIQARIFCKESLLWHRDFFTICICVRMVVTSNSDFCGKWAASFKFAVAILEIVPELVCLRLCWLKLLIKSFGYSFNLCSVLIAEKHLGAKSCGCIITCGSAFQLCGCRLPCLSARSSV